MSGVSFPFEKVSSNLFGTIHRPIAAINFWSRRLKEWREVIGIVDTGADYTVLPRFYADDLGVHLKKECRRKTTKGIGGNEVIFLYPRMQISFLSKTLFIPVGFLNRDDLPPLFGRHKFLEKFKVIFQHHQTLFE